MQVPQLRPCENEYAAADETKWNLAFYYLHVTHLNVCLQKKAKKTPAELWLILVALLGDYFKPLKKSRFCNTVSTVFTQINAANRLLFLKIIITDCGIMTAVCIYEKALLSANLSTKTRVSLEQFETEWLLATGCCGNNKCTLYKY